MEINTIITKLLNGTILAVKSVIPFTLDIQKPYLIRQPFEQESISVLIDMAGDIRGRIMIEGINGCMSNIGESMFGMPLEGEMLESFAAAFGNMLAGNIATSLAGEHGYCLPSLWTIPKCMGFMKQSIYPFHWKA
ncbi:chemotaxis protein CheX [Peribacillus sp. NPDC096447]|uniref:chemotaxis protein CheX n=1 Tax=Peribacillus sp. NPDC096447 TaxID=3364394 RepID=UPI003829A20D